MCSKAEKDCEGCKLDSNVCDQIKVYLLRATTISLQDRFLINSMLNSYCVLYRTEKMFTFFQSLSRIVNAFSRDWHTVMQFTEKIVYAWSLLADVNVYPYQNHLATIIDPRSWRIPSLLFALIAVFPVWTSVVFWIERSTNVITFQQCSLQSNSMIRMYYNRTY